MKKLLLTILLLTACGDEREPVEANATVVFIGDSITSEWPLDQFIVGATNAGVSGNETPQMLLRFEADVLASRPALVVIHGGINDIRNRESTDIASLLEMVQLAQAADVRVVVGNVMPTENLGPNRSLKRRLIDTMNDDLRAAADAFGFTLVDYHAATASRSGNADRRKLPDGLHPNLSGYDAMWQKLLPALKREGVVSDPSH